MELNGGQALIKALEIEGVEVMFGLPGWSDPAGVRPDHRFADPPHPRAPRAGRRPHGRGLRPCHGPSRRGHGDERPGGHEHRHAAVRRLHGLDPDGRDHRPGGPASPSAPTPSRSATRPASPSRSPSTTTSSRRPPTSRASSARRSTSPPPAGPGPVLIDIPKDIVDPKNPASAMDWYWPSDADVVAGLPGYRPTTDGPSATRSARRPS